jgi:DHA1 family tetracycline resistance protein-like MFS transporter
MRVKSAPSGKEKSPLFLIFFTVFIDLMGFGIIYPLLPIFANSISHNREIVVGLLLSAYPAMQFLFVPALGGLSDRIGRKPVLLLSVIGSCLSYLLMGYALQPGVRSLPLLFISQIINGVSGANIAAAQAYIADVTTLANRAKGMGMIGAAFGLGFMFGPALGGILGHYNWAYPAYAAAAIAGLNAFGIWRILPESLQKNGERPSVGRRSLLPLGEIAKRPQIALPIFVFFLAQFAAMVTQVAFPLFLSDPKLQWKFDERTIGYGFLYVGFVVALVQGGMIGRMVKRMGETRVAWMGLVILAASYFIFPKVASWAGLLLVLAAMALGQGSIIPSINSLISRRSGSEEQGSVLGINQSVASLARVLGPVWAGWVYSLRPELAYTTAGFALLIAFIASLGFGSA